MRSEGFLFYTGGLGVETCSLNAALVFTTHNHLRTTVMRVKLPCLWGKLQKLVFSKVS